MVYFVKPLAIWYIAGHFTYLSIRAVGNAVLSYQRETRKAEIAARREASPLKGTGKAPEGDSPCGEGAETKPRVRTAESADSTDGAEAKPRGRGSKRRAE